MCDILTAVIHGVIFYQPSQNRCDILTDHHTGVIFYQVNNSGVYKIKVGTKI